MAAFIDEDMTILHINTLVFRTSGANVEQPAVIPISFAKNERSLSCTDGLCTSCSETLPLCTSPAQVSLC